MMIVVLQFLGWEDDPMRVKYIARIWALCDHRLALNPSVLIFSMATVVETGVVRLASAVQ